MAFIRTSPEPDEAMRNSKTFPYESPAETRARLASGFTQHVTVALAVCLLALGGVHDPCLAHGPGRYLSRAA